jgi:CelD/BcsL family acetyltransferase involved in cellulose biosynthesis
MGYQSTTIDRAAVTPGLARAWDALPAQRGLQADVYDSHAWLSSWWDTTPTGTGDAVRILAVLDGDRPLGLLPLVARSSGRWEFAGRGGGRMRYRPVLGSEEPDQEVVGLLAEQVGRAGVRDLTLPRMPGRDPATGALAVALRRAGFRVATREKSSDCLALVAGGWAEHRSRFGGYEKSVKRFANRLRSLWDVRLDEYGPGADAPLDEGYRVFTEVHAQSWKKPLTPVMREQARMLLGRAAALGWPRIFVLRVAGVPAAAHIWFRVGPVVTWLETAYDQRLSALGPGTILMWWSQERLFQEAAPRVVDFIPGHNPQKDRLGPDRTPIVILEAVRRTLVSGATFPVQRQARYVLPAVAFRVRRKLSSLRPAGPAGHDAARTVEVAPGGGEEAVTELELGASFRRLLAAVTGHHSPDAMASTWPPGDSWWRVGDRPRALVRLGAPTATSEARPVREIVLFQATSDQVQEVLAAVATAVGGPVRADLTAAEDAAEDAAGAATPIPVTQAMLPWPEREEALRR